MLAGHKGRPTRLEPKVFEFDPSPSEVGSQFFATWNSPCPLATAYLCHNVRRFLKHNRWATALVACLFMVATSGMTISRMTCLIGGHSALSIGTPADCCPDEEEQGGPTIQPQCCVHASVKGEQHEFIVHQDVDLAPALIALYAAPRLLLSEGNAPVLFLVDDLPPPLDTPARLAVLCTQRI